MLSGILAASLLIGQWGVGGCGPVGPEAFTPVTKEIKSGPVQNLPCLPRADLIGRGCEWRFRPDDPNRAYLYREDVQIGGWDTKLRRWMDYDAATQKWTDGYPPWFADVVPHGNQNVGQVYFGVDRSQVPQQETFSINGHRLTYFNFRTAQSVFGDDTLTDDSGKLRITMSGPKDVRDRVKSDLKSHPAMASMSNRFLVQSYEAGAWPMGVFNRPPGDGFYLSISGPPDKRGRGVEYHSQTHYESPDQFAVAMDGALRKADPNYDGSKTPDLTKPKPLPVPPSDSSNLTWIVVAIIAAFLFGGKRNANS